MEERGRHQTGVLQGLPANLEEQPVPRVELGRVARRHVEGGGVEPAMSARKLASVGRRTPGSAGAACGHPGRSLGSGATASYTVWSRSHNPERSTTPPGRRQPTPTIAIGSAGESAAACGVEPSVEPRLRGAIGYTVPSLSRPDGVIFKLLIVSDIWCVDDWQSPPCRERASC